MVQPARRPSDITEFSIGSRRRPHVALESISLRSTVRSTTIPPTQMTWVRFSSLPKSGKCCVTRVSSAAFPLLSLNTQAQEAPWRPASQTGRADGCQNRKPACPHHELHEHIDKSVHESHHECDAASVVRKPGPSPSWALPR